MLPVLAPQKDLGCRKLDLFIDSKVTFTVALLQGLHIASLTLLPSLAGAMLGFTMPSASCHLMLVLSTPHHSPTLASILPLSQHSCAPNTMLTQDKGVRGVEQGCGQA